MPAPVAELGDAPDVGAAGRRDGRLEAELAAVGVEVDVVEVVLHGRPFDASVAAVQWSSRMM